MADEENLEGKLCEHAGKANEDSRYASIYACKCRVECQSQGSYVDIPLTEVSIRGYGIAAVRQLPLCKKFSVLKDKQINAPEFDG